MPFTTGQRVKLNVKYTDKLPQGISGVVTRILTMSQYDISFDRDPSGNDIKPPIIEEAIPEEDLTSE